MGKVMAQMAGEAAALDLNEKDIDTLKKWLEEE